jgi:hypothetical protein
MSIIEALNGGASGRVLCALAIKENMAIKLGRRRAEIYTAYCAFNCTAETLS